MAQSRGGSAGERRGRHVAPAAGPRGPVDRALAAVLALLALGRERVWVPVAERLAPVRAQVVRPAAERIGAAVAAFRAGPVLPWVSAHRMLVLVGGALLVSAIALGGAAAMIASTPPLAGAEETADESGRPQPGSDFRMPSPVPTSPGPSRTPTPTPTPTPTAPGSADTTTEPDATDAPVEPTTEPVDDDPGNSGTSPGATNRPDKPKG